jgi:hypothetical protein
MRKIIELPILNDIVKKKYLFSSNTEWNTCYLDYEFVEEDDTKFIVRMWPVSWGDNDLVAIDGFGAYYFNKPKEEELQHVLNKFVWEALVSLNTPDEQLEEIKEKQKEISNKRNLIYKLKQKWNSIF